ncbi:MAG: ABC transporter substrate-binding protein [Oscillospiraceae bacterium]|nr:ABC transporter substrate-binding protein [Oscillospiraceae bacterium]
MKKLLALVLALTMALSMTACGGEETTTEETTEKVKIGILQQLEHVALDQSREGFVQALKDNGLVDGENLVLDIQNAQSDQSNLQTMSDRLINEGNDLILAIATGAAQTLAGKTTEIPILITAVTDPVDAGLVNSMENPGTNVSGTSDASPMAEQIDLMLQLCPDVKTVGLLYTSSEDNSVLQINQMKEILAGKNLETVEQTVTNSNDVQQATQSLVTKCDAIYIPTDNVLAASMALVGSVANEAKVPVICGEAGMVESGGFATIGIDYYNLGYQTGEMAVKVLNGEDVSTMPVETQKDFAYTINGEVAQILGVTIPEELQEFVITPAA